MDEILKRINKLSVEHLVGTMDEYRTGYYKALNDVKAIILSEQKEPCEYCSGNPCWLCKHAGECRTWQHCAGNDRADYKPIQNYCHICGRSLKPQSTDSQLHKN